MLSRASAAPVSVVEPGKGADPACESLNSEQAIGSKHSGHETVIRVANLSKCYQIYSSPRDRLKQFVLPRLRRLVSGTTKQYFREFWALRDVSFEIRKGETVGIVGRNGSGKSTLLQLICGTLSPTRGSVEIMGRVAALLELGSGFNPEFTGRENVYMSGSLLGLSKEEIDSRFQAIATFADIGDFIEQPVKTYSSGMYVRLAFAVIAHADADVLVIDEALAVGDAFFAQKCMRFLRKFKETGTILFVSHDSGAVVNLCERAIWLEHGCVRGVGPAKAISEGYLASLHESSSPSSSDLRSQDEVPLPEVNMSRAKHVDQRLKWLNLTQYRNDIELFAFDANATSFGKGHARIVDVVLVDSDGSPISWVVGGENVVLKIRAEALQAIISPIIGFHVKDRLGQTLFGDNTYLSYWRQPLKVSAGTSIEGRFEFVMPVLPAGDYSISAAIAEGTQESHIQHHWLHDALIMRSHSTSVSTGLVGIGMNNIAIAVVSG